MNSIDICFVFFRSTGLEHLDAAWYSVSRQDFWHVNSVHFLDNNTEFSPSQIQEVLFRYPLPVPLYLEFNKHGDTSKTHSWSVNRVCKQTQAPWIFFTRSDYILDFDTVKKFSENTGEFAKDMFVTSWCWQLAYDQYLSNTDAIVDIEQYNWRELGSLGLQRHPFHVEFQATDQDAGVWLTRKATLERAGWMNEQLTSWGFQQSTFQRVMRRGTTTNIHVMHEYLFFHQHHYADRNFDRARNEYERFGAGK